MDVLTGKAAWRSPLLGEMRDFELSHGSLRCYEAGAGEPLLFLHGMLVNANAWRLVVDRLSPDFRCITVDLPMGGHVRPAHATRLSLDVISEMVRELIERLGVERVTLVGNDTGTALCQIIATRSPSLVHKLILTSGDYRANSPATLFRFVRWLARIPGGSWLYLSPGLLGIRALERLPISYGWLLKRSPSQQVVASYFHPALRSRAILRDYNAFARDYHNRYALAAAPLLKGLGCPVLIAWSREDRFFPPAHAVELSRVLPDARLEWIDDSYTISAEDQPERLAELIGEFVREPRVSKVPS